MTLKGKDQSELLDSREARAVLRISESRLRKLQKDGLLKRSAVSVGRALFSVAEIQRLINTPLEPKVA